MLLLIDDKIPFMRGQAERLGRAVYLPGAVFVSGESGFSFIAADRHSLTLYMLAKEGRTLHKIERTK